MLILAAFRAFASDPLVRLPLEDARRLYEEMIGNTANYLTEYKNI